MFRHGVSVCRSTSFPQVISTPSPGGTATTSGLRFSPTGDPSGCPPLRGGVQLAIGRPRRHQCNTVGGAFRIARANKKRTHTVALARLVVPLRRACHQVAGRWSAGAIQFVRHLFRCRARSAAAHLRASITAAWVAAMGHCPSYAQPTRPVVRNLHGDLDLPFHRHQKRVPEETNEILPVQPPAATCSPQHRLGRCQTARRMPVACPMCIQTALHSTPAGHQRRLLAGASGGALPPANGNVHRDGTR